MSRVTLCVAESESGPGALSPGRLPIHGPTQLVTSVAAASFRLGFCRVHPCSAQTCPIPLRRGDAQHSLLLSQFPHLLDEGGVPATPGPPSSPLLGVPGLVSPGDSEVEMEAGSLPSGHPLCFFPLGCWALFIGHIPPDYTDPPSPRPLLGGDHVSLSQPEFPQSLPRGPTLQ